MSLDEAAIAAAYGSVSSYKTTHSKHCECKGTGLIPPSPVPRGTLQAYCPHHRLRYRQWPRATANGGTEFVWIDNIKGCVIDGAPRNPGELY